MINCGWTTRELAALTGERDRARDLAVRLEGLVASLRAELASCRAERIRARQEDDAGDEDE